MNVLEDSMQKHEKSCIVKDNRSYLIKYCPLLGGSLKAPRCDSLSLLSNSPLGLLGTRQGLATLLLPFNQINLIQYFRIPYIQYFSTVNIGGSLKAPRCDSLSLLSNSPLGLLGTRQGLATLLLPFNQINLIQYFRIPYIQYFSTVNMSSFTSHVGTMCHFFHFQILGSLTTTIYRC